MQQSYEFVLEGTTDGSGNATLYTPKIRGFVDRIIVDNGTLASGAADLTITDDQTPAQPIVTITNIAAAKILHPRQLVQDAAAADIAGAYSMAYIHNARVKVAVAQGGAAATFKVKILVLAEAVEVV